MFNLSMCETCVILLTSLLLSATSRYLDKSGQDGRQKDSSFNISVHFISPAVLGGSVEEEARKRSPNSVLNVTLTFNSQLNNWLMGPAHDMQQKRAEYISEARGKVAATNKHVCCYWTIDCSKAKCVAPLHKYKVWEFKRADFLSALCHCCGKEAQTLQQIENLA